MADALAIFLIVLLAVLLIGPAKLPAGLEALWLSWTNFNRSQHGAEPISLDTARKQWQREQSPLYSGIQLLYAATEHLAELRRRLFVAFFAFAICVGISFFFSRQILDLLLAPLSNIQAQPRQTTTIIILSETVPISATLPSASPPVSITVDLPAGTRLPARFELPGERIQPIFTKPTEMIVTTFMIGLYAGAGLALPVIVYEMVAFLLPGLLPHERRYLFFLLPGIALFFIGGVAFAYFYMLPFALQFLFTFGADQVQPLPSIGEYIHFVTSVLFWIGLSFETPLVVFFLAKVKLVNVRKLKSFRRFAYVIAFVLAALITPTPDPVNQSIVAIPIIALYEIGILLARFA